MIDAIFDPITSSLQIMTPSYDMISNTWEEVDVWVALDGETWIQLDIKYAYTKSTATLVEPTQVTI